MNQQIRVLVSKHDLERYRAAAVRDGFEGNVSAWIRWQLDRYLSGENPTDAKQLLRSPDPTLEQIADEKAKIRAKKSK